MRQRKVTRPESPKNFGLRGKIDQSGRLPHERGGGVAVIDHTGKVETTFVIPVAQCSSPQGMAIGPDHQILLGCNGVVNANASTSSSKSSGPD